MGSCLRYLLIIASLCSLVDAQYDPDHCLAFKPVGAKCHKNRDCGNSTAKGSASTCDHLCGAEKKWCIISDTIPAGNCLGCTTLGCVGHANECCSGQCYGVSAAWHGWFWRCKSDTDVIALNASNRTGTPWVPFEFLSFAIRIRDLRSNWFTHTYEITCIVLWDYMYCFVRLYM